MIKDHLNSSFDIIIEHLENQLSEKSGCSIEILDNDLKSALSKLFYKMRTKWHYVHRIEEKFFAKYNEWLNASVAFLVPAVTPAVNKNIQQNKVGRPSSKFTSSSERTKRRKTEEIRSKFTLETLSYATQMSLRASGNLDASKVVKDVTSTSPSRATKYRKAMKSTSETRLSGEAALLLLIEQKLSKSQYTGLRAMSLENNCNLYPPYKTILQTKRECYPLSMDITITEYSAEVKLQALLDHTVERILLVQNDVIKNLAPENLSRITLICKWGCDGSSGQSVYKQAFTDETKSDSDIFLTSIVPLQLISVNHKNEKEIIVWKNPRPSSPRFCRPIRLQFLHENTQATKNEINYIEEQIKTLVPFKKIIDGKEISIRYNLALTMINGKVCNAVSSTLSAQRCYLCGATSKQFNQIDEIIKKELNENYLRFGLSTLHAWIRFFECCLHLSYKLDIKKWQTRNKEEKQMIENRKAMIQKGFRLQLGLIVDRPKPGFGSTNDGNTARRFFENAIISASITGVDENLINRFYVILQVISCGHDIDLLKFEEYAVATARKFVELYPWYYMPTSVHKLLIHGQKIIASALLPIGQMSEDAQEAMNKYIKRFREDFSRKCSRVKTMEDVFLRLMITSDPYISSLRKLPQKKLKTLSPDALKLLIPPKIQAAEHTETQLRPEDSSFPETSEDDDEESDDENLFE